MWHLQSSSGIALTTKCYHTKATGIDHLVEPVALLLGLAIGLNLVAAVRWLDLAYNEPVTWW
jgi:hypothetical protein